MQTLDYIVIVVYLVVMMGMGMHFGRGQSRREFFAAGGSMGWMVVGLSVMATLFSSNSFAMYPSVGYGDSLRVGMMLVGATLMSPIVIWVFIPVYSRLNCTTAYEYLERRFHVSIRCLASGLFILLRIGWMASATFAASLVIASVSQVPQVTVILSLGAVSILYTMVGGLRAVMWTDVLQFFVFGGTILVALSLLIYTSGIGFTQSISSYFEGRSSMLVDWTPSMTLKHGSWAVLIGTFLEALSAFGADQVAVQRYISAKSERTSQIGYLVNLIGMWLVIPGLLLIGVGLFAFYGENPAELQPLLQGVSVGELPSPLESVAMRDAVLAAGAQDKVFPEFARMHFPPGMVGLFLVALMAAVMSSIDSGIHSVTTAIIVDFRDRLLPSWKPDDSAHDVGLIRGLLVVVGVLSVTLACFVGPLGDVFDIAKKLTASFGGPLLAVFILAFFSRKARAAAVFPGTLIAAAATMAMMYHFDQWFSMWFWPVGFGLTLVLCFVINLCLPRTAGSGEEPLTFATVMRQNPKREQELPSE
ncbi:sodium:solute symporter family transporter [Rosistilla oblonga]|uniref:sodium:solute symporter family transporter n=1 Tax=Rosistilla oblonga TaxID=2527990 RepID=UPI003A97261D